MKLPLRAATRVVHPPFDPAEFTYAPVVPPIYPSVAYATRTAREASEILGGTRKGFVYGRVGNPTVALFAAAVAELEGGEAADAVAFSSGMAAITASLVALGARAGSRVLASRDLYGNTWGLLVGEFAAWGVRAERVDTSDLRAVERALRRPAAVLVVEAISNPLLRVPDLEALSRIARGRDAKLLVDATFASPLLSHALEAGAHAVVHSATKFLGGHGDLTAGVAVAPEFGPALRRTMINLGSCLSPHDAWLALRGMKTLELRLRRQCRNAAALAARLSRHDLVGRVWYPGLPSHPDHVVASRRFGAAFGEVEGAVACCGLVAFEVRPGTTRAAWRVMDRLRLILRATTLAETETLVLHPATASHRQVSPRDRKAADISDGLIRLSAGIEDVDDLWADLTRALRAT